MVLVLWNPDTLLKTSILGCEGAKSRFWDFVVTVKNIENSLDCHLISTQNKWFIFIANSTASVILSCQQLTVRVTVILRWELLRQTVLNVAAARDDGSGNSDNQKSLKCKVPVISPPPTCYCSVLLYKTSFSTQWQPNKSNQSLPFLHCSNPPSSRIHCASLASPH